MDHHTPTQEPKHPIRVVATRTGLTPSALRAWERRYGAVTPSRSAGGQRLYSEADLRRLTLLRQVTDAGRSIGSVVGHSDEELQELARGDAEAVLARGPGLSRVTDDSFEAPLDRCLQATFSLDEEALEAELEWVLTRHGAEALTDRLVIPLLHEIGARWMAREMTPAHEHFASAVIHRVAGRLLGGAVRSATVDHRAVIATLTGESHDLGALMAAVSARVVGWHVTFLGADLPGADIAAAARSLDAALVGLSVVNPNGTIGEQTSELEALLRGLGQDVRVILGGPHAERLGGRSDDPRVSRVSTLAGFRTLLSGSLAEAAGDG